MTHIQPIRSGSSQHQRAKHGWASASKPLLVLKKRPETSRLPSCEHSSDDKH